MISWLLIIASVIGLILLFARRMRSTQKDLAFQEHLAGEETPPAEVKLESVSERAAEDEEPVTNPEEFMLLEIIAGDQEHLDAHHKLGLLYMKRANFPQAELYFSKLVNLKQDPVYFSNLGAALYQQQRLVEAAEAYENAIALDDRRAERLQSLAQVYYELGQVEKALEYFERASIRKPKDTELKLIIGDLYSALNRPQDE